MYSLTVATSWVS